MKVNIRTYTVFTVYITKYALTKGIREVTVRETSSPEIVEQVSDTLFGVYHHKGEWHRSKEDAIAQAEKMKQAKIKSLEKQITKMKAMKFE